MTGGTRDLSMDDIPLELFIQRCVDGELNEQSEQNLLSRLEFLPGGWRSLALAFIEHRVLDQVSSEVTREDVAAAGPVVERNNLFRRRSWLQFGVAVATVLLAFWVGRRTVSNAVPHVLEPNLVESSRRTVVPEPHQDAAPHSISRTAGEGGHVVAGTAKQQPSMFVRLDLPGAGESVDVPVFSLPEDAAAWEPFPEPALTAEEVHFLRQAGYQVESRRELMTFVTSDGREVVLPLEAVGVQVARY
ncbi:MAG: hypothetical protein KDA75_01765 [Planctomycetaceae bacterium]|nr:hypothetical protein [Planctomycetaceae bacterium]